MADQGLNCSQDTERGHTYSFCGLHGSYVPCRTVGKCKIWVNFSITAPPYSVKSAQCNCSKDQVMWEQVIANPTATPLSMQRKWLKPPHNYLMPLAFVMMDEIVFILRPEALCLDLTQKPPSLTRELTWLRKPAGWAAAVLLRRGRIL